MRNIFLAAMVATAVTGCDPTFSVRVQVTVPREVQAAWDAGYPAEVSARLLMPGMGPSSGLRLGHFCEPAGADVSFQGGMGSLGCPETVTVEAWMAPAPDGGTCPVSGGTIVGQEQLPATAFETAPVRGQDALSGVGCREEKSSFIELTAP